MRPRPSAWRLVQPRAGPREIVGRGESVSSGRNEGVPAVVTRPRLQRAHQPQLQRVTAMLLQNAHSTKISRVNCARRGNDPGEANRGRFVKGEPPMPMIEFRDGSTVEKCQAVEVRE